MPTSPAPSLPQPSRDPRRHFHGYAIVRGGTHYPFDGATYDVIGVEIRRVDGKVAGPYVGGGGLPRQRSATMVATRDVIAITQAYPKPSDVYRILRHRASAERPAETAAAAPRRVAPRLARVLLATTTWSPATLWRLPHRAASAGPVIVINPGAVGKSSDAVRYIPERGHAL